MEDFLIEILNTFGYPIYRQGSLEENEPYPEIFFTFWNNTSGDGNHYDNKEISVIWDFDVNAYGSSPTLVYGTLSDAITLLKDNKFIISGRGYDVVSDEKTHVGRGINVQYVEKI